MKTSFLNIEHKPAQRSYFYDIRNDNKDGLASVQLISEYLLVIKKNFGYNPSDSIDTTLSSIDTTLSSIDTTLSSIDTKLSRIDTKLSRIDTTLSSIDTKLSRIDTSLSFIDTSLSCIDNFGGNAANIPVLLYNHLAFIK